MKRTLTGTGGDRVVLGRELGAGGEGTVYAVEGRPGVVAKLYRPETAPDRLGMVENKLRVMAGDRDFQPYYEDGGVRFAWPLDLLYEGGAFRGFLMPSAEGAYQFHQLMREEQRTRFDRYDYDRSIAVAFNLAQTVDYAHRKGYVLGDMNLKNFRFDGQCRVIVLDVDSFDVRDRATGAHYKCCVGMEEYLAPELQGCGSLALERNQFTAASDDFSLAVLVFRFLMDGAHPFNAPRIRTAEDYRDSSSVTGAMEEILNGFCPYVRAGTGRKVPAYAPDFSMLPAALQALFRRTFNYSQVTVLRAIPYRATAEEFAAALYQFFQRRKVVCAADSRHRYLPRLGSCPFCAARRRQARLQSGE